MTIRRAEGGGNGSTDVERRALHVLRENGIGGATSPSRALYPHQWSWDSAFIAIGLSHLDARRAAQELRTLLDAQWGPARSPHRLRPRRATARLLPRGRPLELRRALPRLPQGSHQRPLPAPVHAIVALRASGKLAGKREQTKPS
jgi:hypothetical protein